MVDFKKLNEEKTMMRAGFVEASGESINSLFISISGHDNTGKSHFTLTAPGDIAFYDFDKGLKGVINKFANDKRVLIKKVHIPRPQTEMKTVEKGEGSNKTKIQKNVQIVTKEVTEQARESLNDVIDSARMVMADDSIRTMVFDTGGALWELWRVARFGKILQVPASAYPPVNAEFVGFCDELKDSGKNIIFTHKMRSVYVNDKKTDRFEPASFGSMAYITDISLLTSYDEYVENGFHLMITRCKAYPELQFDETLSPEIIKDFPTLASIVVDGTTPEDWV